MNLRTSAWASVLAVVAAAAVQAQSPPSPAADPSPPLREKPAPNPSPSLGTRANPETSQLPATLDAGQPGVGQNLPLGTAGLTHLRRRPPAPSASDAARGPVNDSAAAKLAGRASPAASSSGR